MPILVLVSPITDWGTTRPFIPKSVNCTMPQPPAELLDTVIIHLSLAYCMHLLIKAVYLIQIRRFGLRNLTAWNQPQTCRIIAMHLTPTRWFSPAHRTEPPHPTTQQQIIPCLAPPPSKHLPSDRSPRPKSPCPPRSSATQPRPNTPRSALTRRDPLRSPLTSHGTIQPRWTPPTR